MVDRFYGAFRNLFFVFFRFCMLLLSLLLLLLSITLDAASVASMRCPRLHVDDDAKLRRFVLTRDGRATNFGLVIWGASLMVFN
jgi:hypothetical protein